MSIKLPNIAFTVTCPDCGKTQTLNLRDAITEKSPAIKQRIANTVRSLASKLDPEANS